uniref:FLYWCH-type domain-containing protein n=1 Tax=Panagrellus redivivus TaxID=6233 RepID=A0A7E4VF31_PANRE
MDIHQTLKTPVTKPPAKNPTKFQNPNFVGFYCGKKLTASSNSATIRYGCRHRRAEFRWLCRGFKRSVWITIFVPNEADSDQQLKHFGAYSNEINY